MLRSEDYGDAWKWNGLLCNGAKVTNMRLIALQPFCAYAQGGFIQDLYNDGLQPDIDGISGYFGATLSAGIPAGTPAGPGNPVAVDIANMAPPTGSPPYPSDRARFVLFDGGTFDDPYCIDLDATDPGTGIQICVNGSYAANRDQYQVRLGDGGIEWDQAGQRGHRILATGPVNNAYPNGPQLDDVHAGRDPNGFEFSLGLSGGYGGAGRTDEVILGSEPGTDLTLDVKPMLLTEIPDGSKITNLPSDIPSLEGFLNSLWDGDPSGQGKKEYPAAALSINDWVKANHQIFQGFNAILRVGGGAHYSSQNFLECDLGEGDLYDPKFSYLRNQYVLAASFGMMQVGMITFDQDDDLGRVLTSEYDLRDAHRHMLYLAKYPRVAIRAGTAVDKYRLYASTGGEAFQTNCKEDCQVSQLRSRVRGMLVLFNGSAAYPAHVIDDADTVGGPSRIEYFSTHPEIWRKP